MQQWSEPYCLRRGACKRFSFPLAPSLTSCFLLDPMRWCRLSIVLSSSHCCCCRLYLSLLSSSTSAAVLLSDVLHCARLALRALHNLILGNECARV